MELHELTAHELLDKYRKKKIEPEETVRSAFARIRAVEDKIQAFLHLDEESALSVARGLKDADRSLPLYGVPIAVKDNICTRGAPTTCGSKILQNFIPPYNATVVERITAAGAIIVGKTNMDEFAMGSSTENSGFHTTRNPWDTERVPGGSSGGSAAAVAAHMTPLAIGSDTGGSIRQPAANCGVIGMKPTYGAVSRYGLVAFASSLDQIGPFARDVSDCALLLNVLAAHDPRDSTSVPRDYPDYTKSPRDDVKGLRIGVIEELLRNGMEAGVMDAMSRAQDILRAAGAELINVSMPNIKYCVPTYYIIAPAEASSNLARYDGVQYGLRSKKAADIIGMYSNTRREGFGDEVKRRIMLGTYALSAGYYDAYYLKALRVRTLIVRDFKNAFEKCDALISPTAPTTAFRIGERVDDPLSMYMSDICTIPVNLAGIPAISVPCGTSAGLPVGLQIIGRAFDEETILRAAFAFTRRIPPERCPI